MEHLALWNTIQFASHQSQAPTHIDFLTMGKEATIQAAYSPVVRASNKHTGPCCPLDFHRIVILALVILYRIKYAATTIGITILINESATSTRILETMTIGDRENFRLACCHIMICFHKPQHRLNPIRRHFDIRIQQEIILSINLLQSFVISVSETIILIQFDNTHIWKIAIQQLKRIVTRSIVCHKDNTIGDKIGLQYGQEAFQHIPPIPIQYNNGYFHINSAFRADLSWLKSPNLTRRIWLSYSVLASLGDSSTRI